MTHSITAFFTALSAFVSNESDPWSVGDPQDMWAMQQGSLAFEAWEHSVGGVHPDACVCFFCRNKPSLVEAAADAETRGWELSKEEEVDGDFPAETDLDDADCPLCWWNLPHSDAAHAQALLRV